MPEVMPTVQNSTEPTEDKLSPTTMVLSYLSKQGLKPTSENVRRALEQNNRDPTTIAGLINDIPGNGIDVGAGSNASGAGRGGGSAGRGIPLPPVPPAVAKADDDAAQPASNGMSLADLAGMILGGGAAGAALNKFARPAGTDAPVPVGAPSASDVMRLPPSDPYHISGPDAALALPPPAQQITGPQAAPEAAMARPGEVIPLPGSTPPTSAPAATGGSGNGLLDAMAKAVQPQTQPVDPNFVPGVQPVSPSVAAAARPPGVTSPAVIPSHVPARMPTRVRIPTLVR